MLKKSQICSIICNNFKAFCWNFSSSTNSEIVKSVSRLCLFDHVLISGVENFKKVDQPLHFCCSPTRWIGFLSEIFIGFFFKCSKTFTQEFYCILTKIFFLSFTCLSEDCLVSITSSDMLSTWSVKIFLALYYRYEILLTR